MVNEATLDRLHNKAEARGWSDEAMVADNEGQETAESLYLAPKKIVIQR